MDNYIKNILQNHELETETIQTDSTYNNVKEGGSDRDIPNGGFPPIYLCDDKLDNIPTDEPIKRAYSTINNVVSIKDIIQQRKNI